MNFEKKIPMILTILRFILVIPYIIFLLLDKPLYMIISLVIYILASITDWLDGFFARKFNAVSQLGAFLDPLADKILTLSAFIIFSLKQYVYLPFFLVFILFFREYFVTMMRVEIDISNKFEKGIEKKEEKDKIKFVTSKEAKFKTAFQMFTILVFYLFYVINKKYLHITFLTDALFYLSYIPLLLFSISIILAYYSSIKYVLNYPNFALETLTKTVSTFFYTGYFPIASGTFTSFLTLIIFNLLKPSLLVLLLSIIILFIFGLIFSSKLEKKLMIKDPSIIVIDEVVGMLISLIPLVLFFEFNSFFVNLLNIEKLGFDKFINTKYFYIFISFIIFIIFRFFDILKPFVIKKVQKISGGFGIMIDDILSAFATIISFFIICAIILLFN
ncbi:MAG: phosphatidylglycerophosphatase A [Exilispira sp.]|jgi:CDP-diacylglycerol--glycerol-3-phosphate 3-phosphatidyltransferase|nr:phosphatidylglycerophosphatase A [Exilispira sp.]